MKNVILYHGQCQDGFGSAWVANMFLKNASFVPMMYGDKLPKFKGKNVYILDFSFKKDILLDMCKTANKVVLIDHHKSAMEDLSSIENKPDNLEIIFDMTKSGTLLTWEYFFPDEYPSKMVNMISDRDLWQFKLDDTKAFCEYLFGAEYDFGTWDRINTACKHNREDYDFFIDRGNSIIDFKRSKCQEVIKNSSFFLTIGGLKIKCVNAPRFLCSDICNEMISQGESAAASFYVEGIDKVLFSLRSSKEGPDVSLIGGVYGGGGHKQASGFVADFKTFQEFFK